jgi:hypothetical protein
MTCYEFNTGQLSFPNSIQFYATIKNKKIEVMRFTGDGVWANPDVAVDETAKAVLDALDLYVKALVRNAVAAEREACAEVCEMRKILEVDYEDERHYNQGIEHCAAAIRARGEA